MDCGKAHIWDNRKCLYCENQKLKEQLSRLVCAVYEHAKEGTELMEIAEQIDKMD